jgi:hypothetical protein
MSALIGELTLVPLVKGKRDTIRKDGAAIFTADTPIKSNKNHRCHLLKEGMEYVVFGGNGKYPGRGYTAGGTERSSGHKAGWLAKAGYFDVRTGPGGSKKAARTFIEDLKVLMGIMGGTAIGVNRLGEWVDLETLSLMAKGVAWKDVLKMVIKPFAAADYADRLKEYTKEKGHFSHIPEDQKELEKVISEQFMTAENLRLRLSTLQITLGVFAKAMTKAGYPVQKPFLSKILNGNKPFPVDLQRKAKQVLDQWEGANPYDHEGEICMVPPPKSSKPLEKSQKEEE